MPLFPMDGSAIVPQADMCQETTPGSPSEIRVTAQTAQRGWNEDKKDKLFQWPAHAPHPVGGAAAGSATTAIPGPERALLTQPVSAGRVALALEPLKALRIEVFPMVLWLCE